MFILRAIWSFLTSRRLWTFIGLVCLAAIVWLFGPLVPFGEARPFAGELARLALILGLLLCWLVWLVVTQRRAIRANRLFVAELAVPEPQPIDAAAQAASSSPSTSPTTCTASAAPATATGSSPRTRC
jgi:type VI secretion system protein ImpL